MELLFNIILYGVILPIAFGYFFLWADGDLDKPPFKKNKEDDTLTEGGEVTRSER